MSLPRATGVLILSAAIAACGSTASQKRIDYEKAVTAAPLDVPPPLQHPAMGPDGVEVPAALKAEEAPVLPQTANIRMQRAGDMRWLVVEADPEQLWPQMREFLVGQGLEIKSEDAKLGFIETQWAENRADIPQTFIRGIISKLAPKLYGAATRDRYRVRLERGELARTTEIYLTHYGLEQVNRGEDVVWQPRPSDPELVIEMLNRIMLKLGVFEERAKTVVAESGDRSSPAQFEGDTLVIEEGFPRAWRLVGIALDRIGLVVEDLDRSQGVYYVRQSEVFKMPEAQEKKSWFSRFTSSGSEERHFHLRVQGNENSSRATVLDDKDQPLPSDLAKVILTRVQEQLH